MLTLQDGQQDISRPPPLSHRSGPRSLPQPRNGRPSPSPPGEVEPRLPHIPSPPSGACKSVCSADVSRRATAFVAVRHDRPRSPRLFHGDPSKLSALARSRHGRAESRSLRAGRPFSAATHPRARRCSRGTAGWQHTRLKSKLAASTARMPSAFTSPGKRCTPTTPSNSSHPVRCRFGSSLSSTMPRNLCNPPQTSIRGNGSIAFDQRDPEHYQSAIPRPCRNHRRRPEAEHGR